MLRFGVVCGYVLEGFGFGCGGGGGTGGFCGGVFLGFCYFVIFLGLGKRGFKGRGVEI